ncbi:MAG: helix-turn-helix transcriptional regulator [Lachnospiraceae bacterium]|nr:helix-turn-helix transcriptional regulator [Lachnospiraceae bacterium]
MNQKKIGSFLRELRKEEGLTQEQLAEKLNVSGRTISRWETGSNMPDISLLTELAGFFDVSIPEIINGERKGGNMKEETREVAEKMSDYAAAEKETIIRNIRQLSIMGLCALGGYFILDITDAGTQNWLFEKLSLYCQTLVFVTVLLMPLYTTGLLSKIQNRNQHSKFAGLPKIVQIVITIGGAFLGAAMIKLFLVNICGL